MDPTKIAPPRTVGFWGTSLFPLNGMIGAGIFALPAVLVAAVGNFAPWMMLVGGILFEIVTGVLNIQYDYIFGFSFYTAHYYGAWVFIAGFVVHVAIKAPRMWSSLRSRSMREVLRTSREDTVAEPHEPDGLVSSDPAPATLSRRGALEEKAATCDPPLPGETLRVLQNIILSHHGEPEYGALRPPSTPLCCNGSGFSALQAEPVSMRFAHIVLQVIAAYAQAQPGVVS